MLRCIVACAIDVEETCAVVKPPSSNPMLCQDKIKATTLRYIGPNRWQVTVEFDGDKHGIATYTVVDLVSRVTILTSV